MNRNISEFVQLIGEWKLIVNADQVKTGMLTKRQGYVKIFDAVDSGAEILSLIPFDIAGINKLIMINAAGKLYSSDLSGANWGSAILTGLSQTKRWGYTVMSDAAGTKYMILGNGTEVYKTADGVTFTTVSGAPLGKYWTTMFQRVFCSGVEADPDLLHWCSIGDLTDWSAVAPHDSNSQNIDRFSGGVIKNIRALNDRVVIFKERRMKRWDGDTLRTLRTSHGLTAPYSLAEIDGFCFSLDRDAIRLYDGNTTQNISEKIRDLIEGISFASTNVERICGEVFQKRYYLSVGNITDEDGNVITNAWIVYDYNRSIFWLYSLASQAVTMTKFVNSSGVENLYFADTAGVLYKMFSGDTDNTENIEMKLRSHILYPTGGEITIAPKEVVVASRFADEMKFMIAADEGAPINVGELDKPVTTLVAPDEFGDGCRGLELIIEHSAAGRPSFKGCTIKYDVVSDNRKE